MLSYMICLYVLALNPLLIISFANIFSHSIGYFFILYYFISSWDITEETISELEDVPIEISKAEKQREKKVEKEQKRIPKKCGKTNM